jgi:hypothetical protein
MSDSPSAAIPSRRTFDIHLATFSPSALRAFKS